MTRKANGFRQHIKHVSHGDKQKASHHKPCLKENKLIHRWLINQRYKWKCCFFILSMQLEGTQYQINSMQLISADQIQARKCEYFHVWNSLVPEVSQTRGQILFNHSLRLMDVREIPLAQSLIRISLKDATLFHYLVLLSAEFHWKISDKN